MPATLVTAGAISGGDLVFTPAAAATGSPYTSFTFQVRDNGGTVGVNLDPTPRMMTINVVGSAANRQPNARNDVNLTVPESAGSTALDVLANDTDPDGDTLLITAKTNGDHGKVAITGGGTGLTYNPKQLYVGNDVFTYTVSDGRGGTDTASVLVTVARDTTKPITIAPLERYKKGTVAGKSAKVRLSWSATDSGTGVASYKLQVSTNGGSYRTIALPKATSTTIKRSLTDKATYRFRVRATDKEGNRSAYAYGPSLTSIRVQDTSASLTYSGSWGTKRTARASGGTAHFATSTSAAVSITQTMRDVAWVAAKTPTSGQAEVWIDGNLAATINLRGPKAYRKVVFQAHFATLASHTLEIRPIGGGRVYLDAILLVR